MLNFLRRLRRRWMGPTIREILWMIHTDLSALTEIKDELARISCDLTEAVTQAKRLGTQHREAAARIEQAETRMAEFLERMNGQPFMALKKWLDECTKSSGDFIEQRREFVERERLLLDRWKNHVEAVAGSSA